MRTKLNEVIRDRRSIRVLERSETITKKKIEDMLRLALYAPNAFNMQSSRMIVLLGREHEKFWDMTKDILRGVTPPDAFARTEKKMDGFRGGNGTVLFFENMQTVQKYQQDFVLYADKFGQFSQHNNAILQYAVWLVFEEENIAASLQHYNPLVDEAVRNEWNVPEEWELIAQMPFGKAAERPEKRDFEPFDDIVKIYG